MRPLLRKLRPLHPPALPRLRLRPRSHISSSRVMFTWGLPCRRHRLFHKMRAWQTQRTARSNVRRAWNWPRKIPASLATDRYVANHF